VQDLKRVYEQARRTAQEHAQVAGVLGPPEIARVVERFALRAYAKGRRALKPGDEYLDREGRPKRVYQVYCDVEGCENALQATVGFPVERPIDPDHPNAGHGIICEECAPQWRALVAADQEMKEQRKARLHQKLAKLIGEDASAEEIEALLKGQ
jgi:hypothetical protein